MSKSLKVIVILISAIITILATHVIETLVGRPITKRIEDIAKRKGKFKLILPAVLTSVVLIFLATLMSFNASTGTCAQISDISTQIALVQTQIAIAAERDVPGPTATALAKKLSSLQKEKTELEKRILSIPSSPKIITPIPPVIKDAFYAYYGWYVDSLYKWNSRYFLRLDSPKDGMPQKYDFIVAINQVNARARALPSARKVGVVMPGDILEVISVTSLKSIQDGDYIWVYVRCIQCKRLKSGITLNK